MHTLTCRYMYFRHRPVLLQYPSRFVTPSFIPFFTFTALFCVEQYLILDLTCVTSFGSTLGPIPAIKLRGPVLKRRRLLVSKDVVNASSSGHQQMSDSLTFMYISTPYRRLSSSVMNTLSSSSSSGPSFRGVSSSGE